MNLLCGLRMLVVVAMVDLQWNAGKLVSGSIQSKLGKDCTVHYGDTVKTFRTQKGVEYDVASVLGL